MKHEDEDGLEIWRKTINSLDMSGLPLPPYEEPEPPHTERELIQKIWDEGDESAKWDKMYAMMPEEQPDFGDSHIKTPEELEVGMIVVSVTTENRWVQEIVILKTYSVAENGYAGYEYVYFRDWLDRNEKHVIFGKIGSYADSGLLPYDDSSPRASGKWHTYNHLCFTGEYMSERDLEELSETEQEPHSRSGDRSYGPFGDTEQIREKFRRVYGLKRKK